MAQLMRAVKRFHYPTGVKHRPGDIFAVKGRHAMQLAMAGLAVMVEDPVPTRAYETRHMEAKPVSAMTVLELREEANKKGINLQSGYIAKADLIGIIERA
jgi:hypothetical protein